MIYMQSEDVDGRVRSVPADTSPSVVDHYDAFQNNKSWIDVKKTGGFVWKVQANNI